MVLCVIRWFIFEMIDVYIVFIYFFGYNGWNV